MIRLLVLFGIVLLAACGKAPSEPHQTVRLSLSIDPATLDPRKARDLDCLNLIRMMFEGLTRTGKSGETELAIADRVLCTDEGHRYLFHLRKSEWSNGDPLTADDFATSWKTILDPNFATDIAYQLYPIKNAKKAKLGEVGLDAVGVVAIDAETLQVDLEMPLPYFLELLSTPPFFPVHPNSHVVNGPFQLKEWRHADRILLEKNPHFWEQEKMKLSGVDFFIVSPDTALRMYDEKELDWIGSPFSSVPPDAVAALAQDNRLQIAPFVGTHFYRINTSGGKKNPLSDVNLRRALSLALDREAIIAHVLQGGQSAARQLVPPCMGLRADGYFLENEEEAKAAFAKCEPPEGPIVISYVNCESDALIAQAVQRQWETVLGIQVELDAVEKKVFYARVGAGAFQIAAGSWIADFNDSINFLEIFKYRDTRVNNTGWEQVDYIDLLDRSEVCKGKEERRDCLARAEKILMDEMPIIPIYHFVLNYLKKDQLVGAILSPMGQLDLRRAYFEPVIEKERTPR